MPESFHSRSFSYPRAAVVLVTMINVQMHLFPTLGSVSLRSGIPRAVTRALASAQIMVRVKWELNKHIDDGPAGGPQIVAISDKVGRVAGRNQPGALLNGQKSLG